MQLLEQHFDAAFAAPDGIRKLRELILTLAMQGKLVEQDPNDQPASELLQEIEQEKRRLVAAGKIKAPKPLPAVEADEVPYEVPAGWVWVRLGDLEPQFQNGISKRDGKTGAPVTVLRLADIKGNRISLLNTRQILLDESELGQYGLEFGDILITRVNGSTDLVGSFIINDSLASNISYCDHFIRMRLPCGGFDSQFLNILSGAKLVRQQIESKFVTTAGQKTVNQTHISTLLVPLPPLAEQRRIVARIDELMARCDELEALRAARERRRVDVHTAALNALLGAQEPAAFAEAWQFLAQHFGDLHRVPRNVAELRKAVLQLAVMGKLVEQDPNDPPASELLRKIQEEKNRLIVAGKIRAPKPLPPVTLEEMPYSVPKGWEWVRLGEVSTTRLGKMLDQAKNKGELKPYLRNTNVQWWKIHLNDIKEMRLEKDELDEFRLECGDLLICEGGEPGRGSIWEDADLEMYFQKALHRVRPFSGVSAHWILFCLQIDAGTGRLDKYFTGATIKHFPGEKLIIYSLPLPPLPEQRRIVAKIDQLMALCDQLEAGLAAQTNTQSALLASVMAAVTPASAAPTRRAAPARAPAAVSADETVRRGPGRPRKEVAAGASTDGEAVTVRRGPGRPRKEPVEAVSAEGAAVVARRGPGRPPKHRAEPAYSIPEATSEADAIRRLEALKIERARGSRQVGLFELEEDAS